VRRELIVVGLGYVGMAVVVEAVRAGISVAGYDTNPEVVSGLRAGRSHIDDLSDDELAVLRAKGFDVADDASVLATGNAVVVCVPTPLSEDGGPDLRAVLHAMESVGSQLSPGTLIVLESTTYPGTTEDVIRPLLEARSGLAVGRDFHLAFSPERIDPGNQRFGLRNTPKVVAGVTPDCTARAIELYSHLVDTVVEARGAREAETAKLLENTYRHVNIALVNEMARFCHELGIDLWEVIRLAATKPFGFQPFYPGPGVGGHCIPIDPNYLSHAVRSTLGYPFRFVELAQEINATMPAYVAHRAQNILNDGGLAINGSRILLLGVTYKANSADQRESPAVALASHLLDLGAKLSYHDPYVHDWDAVPQAAYAEDVAWTASQVDLVILVQNHAAYHLDDLVGAATRFFDTRGVTAPSAATRL
jgi:UDP-N-acetyl-D-glucosamine dehydrogenase